MAHFFQWPNSKSPFEQFKHAVGKGDSKKAIKLTKSIDVRGPFIWPYHKSEPIYPIHYICSRGNKTILEKFLLEFEDTLNQTTKSGLTTLHFAVLHSKWEIIEELLGRGVEVDAKDELRGFSALHIAVEKKNMGAAKRLVEDGMADIFLPDNIGRSPKALAEMYSCKQIVKYFNKFEEQSKYDDHLKRLATEQVRMAKVQDEQQKQTVLLGAHMDNIKNEVEDELRKESEKRKTLQDEMEEFKREIYSKVDEIVRTREIPPQNDRSDPPKIKPPPIPPRTRMKSCSSMNNLSSPPMVAYRQPNQTLSQTPACTTNFTDRNEWFNSPTTGRTPLLPSETGDKPILRHPSLPSLGQFHLHINLPDSSASGSRQRLMDSFGSHMELHSVISESDVTSGFGSAQDIKEEEQLLSGLARFQINKNYSDLLYYIKYDKIEPFLISNGVIDEFDVENIKVLPSNRQKMTYILSDVILKKDNQTLRNFLLALEENGYELHVKKIRETGSMGYYTNRMEEQTGDLRSLQAKSTPNVMQTGCRMAVETSEPVENCEF